MQDQINFVVGEIRSALRFRWFGLAVAFLVCLAGWLYVARLPDIYEAQARFQLDTTSMLERALEGQIIPTDQEGRLNFIRQRLYSTPELEKVVLAAGLDSDVSSDREHELLIESLRRDIFFDSSSPNTSQRSGELIFELRYRHPSRDKAIAVVDTLLNSFIEAAHGESRRDGDDALTVVEAQIAVAEADLFKAEQDLANFKRDNADRLPGEQGDFQRRMQAFEDRLSESRRELNSLKSRRTAQDREVESLPPYVPTSASELSPDSTEARVRDLRQQERELLVRYQDTHPAVLEVRGLKEDAESQLRAEREALGLDGDDPVLLAMQVNPLYQDALTARAETDRQIAESEAEIADYEAELLRLVERRDESLTNEAMLADLDRKVTNAREQLSAYNATRRQLERTQTVESSNPVLYREIDPTNASSMPVEPNRLISVFAVFVVALGAGIAACYGLAQVRPIFSSAKALKQFAEFPVLGTVTNAWPASERTRFRRSVVAFVAAASLLFFCLAGVVAVEIFVDAGIHAPFGGG